MKDLWGNEVDEFVDAKERYGIWPLTVWDCDKSKKDSQTLKELIGDEGRVEVGVNSNGSSRLSSTRAESFTHVSPNSCYRVASSIFDPAVASWILNLYAPKEGICYDPFAGGGTRAILAAKHGLDYVGCEIREEEVLASGARVAEFQKRLI